MERGMFVNGKATPRGVMRRMCMKLKLNFHNYVIYDFSH